MHFKHLTDQTLIETVKAEVKTERAATTRILHLLFEVESRKLFCELKCSSLFEFCTKVLGYSEGSTQRRITAMRLIKKMPEAEEKIASGEITLCVASKV